MKSFTAVLIIPTGIGAAIGGFAGDGIPVARAIAQVVDCLVTHPNVLNGASLFYPLPHVLYTEGYALDRFAEGLWALRPVHFNRIGVIFDRAITSDLLLRHQQAIDAARATLGIAIPEVIFTDRPLQVELRQGTSGATWGTIAHPDSLLRAADQLIATGRIDAIAVVVRFPDDPESLSLQQYRTGQGVDSLAGAEAVISHLITRTFQIPCAHAPALSPLPLDPQVHERAVAEELGYTFLPCVLVGLSRAPQIVTSPAAIGFGDLRAQDVDAVIAPYNAAGSPALLAFAQRSTTQLIFVEENTTVLQVFPQDLGIEGIVVHNYLEAIGVLAALRGGVDPDRLTLGTRRRF